MRIAIVPLLLTSIGCSPGPALALMEALSGPQRADTERLLTTDATLATPERTIEGQQTVHAALVELPSGGRAAGHHDVAQLVLPDALLFAIGAEAVHSLALFEDAEVDAPAAIDDYVAAWNESSADRRESLLGIYAERGRYVDPTADAVGREALLAHLTAFRNSMPGTILERTGPVRQAGRWYAFEWVMTSGETTTLGLDVVELDDAGQLVLVAGFF
jgi:hypothetical protein